MTAHASVRGDVAVVVAAAGAGVRLGPGEPKALRRLAGEPLLVHALRRVLAAASVGYVVVAAPAVAACRALLRDFPVDVVAGGPARQAPVEVVASGASVEVVASRATPQASVEVVAGGATRQASVGLALAAVPSRFEIVLVHDAARALAPTDLVERVAAAVRAGHAAVIPVLPVVDTVKQVDLAGTVIGTVDRSALRIVQTPQGFRRSVLAQAHAAAVDEHTDDAGLVEKLGIPVTTVPGDEAAFKITTSADLARATLLLHGSSGDLGLPFPPGR